MIVSYLLFIAVNVPCLPTSPTSLSIVNCEVVNVPSNKSYFWEMDKRIPNLETLDLSYNNWLTNHALYSLCKFKELKEISFRGCMRIGDTACYTMIATNFGFKNVAKLDLRDTSVGDHELSCFTKLPKVILMQKNSRNYLYFIVFLIRLGNISI